jgi:ATP-binding cassette, subfamily C, bacterial CydC
MRTLAALVRMGRPHPARVARSVALGSLTVLAGVGLMSVAGYLISRSAEHPPILSLTVAIVAVRAFGITRPVARYAERLDSHDLAFRVLGRMRVALFRRLEPQVPARTGGYRQGDLLARMVADVDAMQNLFLRGICPPLVALVTAGVSVGVAALLLPAAAVVLAGGLLLAGVAVPAVAWFAGRRTGKRQAAVRAELTAELVELLRGGPELVALGADEAALARVRRLDAELVRLSRRDALAGGLVEGLGALVAGLTVVGVLAVCVAATGAGRLDRVLVAALALGAMATFEATAPLPATALGLQRTIEAGRRLLTVAGQSPAVSDPAAPTVPPDVVTTALERVDLEAPDGDAWGLEDVDLRLAPGKRVALVGSSGSGKSTVAGLLVRFLDPAAGRVTLGGTDLRELRQQDVRSLVSLDTQDAYLFSTTIRENVRLARPDADDAAIEQALRRARIWDWVASLPAGWDTPVGEEGTLVSGGERRRIALARTFLAGAPVLVLDEPTSHLDPPTARALVADALAAANGRSVLLITHRSEGLDSVDAIVELRHGRATTIKPPNRLGDSP